MKKTPTETLLPATPDNAKHKSRQVSKKNGATNTQNASSPDLSGKTGYSK